MWVWVPADVDFVERFPSNRGFVLGEIDAYQELFCVVTPLRAQRNHDHDAKREKKRNKYSERAAQFLAGVFAVIARLTMSNEIEIAMRSSL